MNISKLLNNFCKEEIVRVDVPCCSLVAKTDSGCILGGSKLGNRKVRPQQTGSDAAEEIISALNQGACVDEHCQDQMIILMALAQGRSRIRVGKVTLHTETAIYVAERLAKVMH